MSGTGGEAPDVVDPTNRKTDGPIDMGGLEGRVRVWGGRALRLANTTETLEAAQAELSALERLVHEGQLTVAQMTAAAENARREMVQAFSAGVTEANKSSIGQQQLAELWLRAFDNPNSPEVSGTAQRNLAVFMALQTGGPVLSISPLDRERRGVLSRVSPVNLHMSYGQLSVVFNDASTPKTVQKQAMHNLSRFNLETHGVTLTSLRDLHEHFVAGEDMITKWFEGDEAGFKPTESIDVNLLFQTSAQQLGVPNYEKVASQIDEKNLELALKVFGLYFAAPDASTSDPLDSHDLTTKARLLTLLAGSQVGEDLLDAIALHVKEEADRAAKEDEEKGITPNKPLHGKERTERRYMSLIMAVVKSQKGHNSHRPADLVETEQYLKDRAEKIRAA